MPNARVPAAAGGLPTITRRTILAGLSALPIAPVYTGVATAAVLPRVAHAASVDPIFALAEAVIEHSKAFDRLDAIAADLDDQHMIARRPRPQEPKRARPVEIEIERRPDGSFTMHSGPTADPEYDAAMLAYDAAMAAWRAEDVTIKEPVGLVQAEADRDAADDRLKAAVEALAQTPATTAAGIAAKARAVAICNPDLNYMSERMTELSASLLRDAVAFGGVA